MTEQIRESENQRVETLASTDLVKTLNETTSFRHADHFSSLVSHLTASLQSNIHNRDYYFKELDNYRNNYITAGIYDIISNDVFVDNGSSDFISVKIDGHEDIEEEINKLFAKLNIANVLQSILPELLHYGSYAIRPIIATGRGIVDLMDNVEPRNVVAITDSKNSPLAFYIANVPIQQPNQFALNGNTNAYNSSRISYEYLPISELLYFSLDLSFSKIVLPEKTIKQFKSKSPDIIKKLMPTAVKIKTSQSLIWPVLDKLKEVLLLDKLSVYRDIGSILTPNLVGIPVPDVYDPNQLIEIVKKYDEILNSNVAKINTNQNMEITLQELSSVKVVPIVGDKSTPAVIDVGRSVPISSLEALNDGISRLLNSIGIPKELFDGSTESKSNMKTNIRYAKKIKRIQKNIIKTLQFLALLHVSEKFPSVNLLTKDITIELKNSCNVDELENMESQDLIISSITAIKGLITELEPIVEKSSYEIDVDKVIENIQESFASMGSKYHSMFKKKEKPTKAVYTNNADQQIPADPDPEEQS